MSGWLVSPSGLSLLMFVLSVMFFCLCPYCGLSVLSVVHWSTACESFVSVLCTLGYSFWWIFCLLLP